MLVFLLGGVVRGCARRFQNKNQPSKLRRALGDKGGNAFAVLGRIGVRVGLRQGRRRRIASRQGAQGLFVEPCGLWRQPRHALNGFIHMGGQCLRRLAAAEKTAGQHVGSAKHGRFQQHLPRFQLAYLASLAENHIYELHRIAKVGAPQKDQDGQRQMALTRGLRNGGGLL